MDDVLLFAILGLGAGAIYAILALGLILVHRGSGVVNFAQGAFALVAALGYVELVDAGLSPGVAMVATVLIATVLGAVLSLVVMARIRHAPVLARLVASLGLLLLLDSGAVVAFGTQPRAVPRILPGDPIEVFGVSFGQDRLWLLAVVIVLTALLAGLMRFTRLGMLTRAVSEQEKGVVILGYSPTIVSAANWALAAALAAVAGILIAPITSLSRTTFTLLIVPALAAALVGGFRSFTLAALAGVLLGVGQSELTRYQGDLPSWLPHQGLQEALPFLVIIVAMMLAGNLVPGRGELIDQRLPAVGSGRPRVLLTTVGVAGTVVALGLLDRATSSALTTSMLAAIVALSLVMVTGYVGQISLAQMTFAGIGGFAVSQLADDLGVAFVPAVVLAALIAVPFGLLLGAPALRVRGVNLAVITIAAAVAFDRVVFQNPDLTGGIDGSAVPSPTLFGWSIDPVAHPQRFGAVVAVVLGLAGLAVANIRRGNTGKQWLAIRSNERAAAASLDVSNHKLTAFAVSAALAGVAGALIGYQTGRIAFPRYDVFQSILLVGALYVASVGSVLGALGAGALVSGGLIVTLSTDVGMDGSLHGVVIGLLVLVTVALAPDGIALAAGRWLRARRAPVKTDAASPSREAVT
jgi:branched-chain amino acid transport system permease protein